MGRIVVIGSMNADLTVRTTRLPRPGETLTGSDLEINPGGKSSNQAAAAAQLGSQVDLVAKVGQDAYADVLRDAAQDAGVNISAVTAQAGAATGTAMIAVDDHAENFIIVSPGANAHVTPETVRHHADVLDGADVLCLCLEIGHDAVLAAAEEAHRRGVTVITNLSPYAQVDPALLAATDVLLVNEHEYADVTGADGLDDAAARLGRVGVRQAVITLGADGALVVDGSQTTRVSSPVVDAVDTTGCGDAFTGALAHRLAAGDDLAAAAAFAATVAAFAATRPGAQRSYPTPDELHAFVAG